MPPKRFNYQQRVGRAGRRGQTFSYSLTLCRDRGHDDYYFNNQGPITGDAPPQPYLDFKGLTIIKRCAASEVLRRAFLGLPESVATPRRTIHSLHGAFGSTSEWGDRYESPISEWIDNNSAEIDTIISFITWRTGKTEAEVDALSKWLKQNLVGQINEAIQSLSYHHSELSLLLANAGLLPMFGFPSRVRNLYSRGLRNIGGERDSAVASRGLDLSVALYGPSRETIKDGSIHRSIGFAAWDFGVGGRAEPIDPLVGPMHLAVCDDCGSMEPTEEENMPVACEVCGSPNKELPMYEPLGFRTNYRVEDYDDDWTDSSSRQMAQISLKNDAISTINSGACIVEVHEQGQKFTINDNGGDLFNVNYMRDRTALVLDKAMYPKGYYLPPEEKPPIRTLSCAIGSKSITDILTVELAGLQEIGRGTAMVIPIGKRVLPAGRAAITSFAHALRREACYHLDVELQEIEVGIQPVKRGDVHTGRVYLADSLDNGAGHASLLGQEDQFKLVLERLASTIPKMDSPQHKRNCDRACPDCLMSYDNRSDHPLLDWRLAQDIIELATGMELNIERWMSRSQALVEDFIDMFHFEGSELEMVTINGSPAVFSGTHGNRTVAIFGHPLWIPNKGMLHEDLAETYFEAMNWLNLNGGRQGGEPEVYDLWTLETAPAAVFRSLNQ